MSQDPSDAAVPAGEMPRDMQPGGESTPLDTEGDGPVGLEDRTRTDEKGSPATNQGKAEPTIPPTPGHADPSAPLDPPALDDMTVGADDPQRPSLGAGLGGTAPASTGSSSAPRGLTGPGAAPADERPIPDTASATGTDRGPEVPVSTTPGRSHRVPGLVGQTSPAEQIETDVDDSAAAMRAGSARDTGRDADSGDPHSVPAVGRTPSTGTSEEHGVVQGARIPASD